MSLLKHLWSGFSILFSRFSGKRIPLKVNFMCTLRCTNRCSYCNIHKIKNHHELDTIQSKKMIMDFRKSGAQLINFIGGEPLLRDDIVELVEYSKKIGLMTSISTNSELLSKRKRILRFLDYYITTLNGPEDIHDRIRGKGNYRKVLSAIDAIPRRIPKIVTFIITNENVEYIAEMLNLAKNRDFKINFQPVFSNELARIDEEQLSDQSISDRHVKKLFNRLIIMKKKGAPISNSYYSLRHFAGTREFSECYIGKYNVTVDPMGNLHRCYKTTNKLGSNSAVNKGVCRALNDMIIDGCKQCNYGCHVEENGLFSFTPSSIYDLVINK